LSASSLAHFPLLCWPAAAAKMQMSSSGSGSDSDSGHWTLDFGLWALDSGQWPKGKGAESEEAEQKALSGVWPTLNEPKTECRQHIPTHCVCYILFTKCKCCLQSLKLKQIYIQARQHIKPKNKNPKNEEKPEHTHTQRQKKRQRKSLSHL